jgi:AcrR family transcriptional regulator
VADTRERLIEAAIRVLATAGFAGASARAIATAAGVNQALVFYHFGTVDQLLSTACQQATQARVGLYRERFAQVSSLGELLAVGQELHDTERAAGNVAVLAQLMAGAQTDAALAAAVADALQLWIVEVEAVLARITTQSPLAEVVDVPGLARAVAASFIGLELYEGVDAGGSASAMRALAGMAVLAEVVDGLGPVARRALRAALRRQGSR